MFSEMIVSNLLSLGSGCRRGFGVLYALPELPNFSKPPVLIAGDGW